MGLAIVGHLGQIIAIVLALLIVVGILIWARWERRRPHQPQNSRNRRGGICDRGNLRWPLTKRGELHLAHLFSDFVRGDLGDDRARAAASLAGLGMERTNPRWKTRRLIVRSQRKALQSLTIDTYWRRSLVRLAM